ncbi:MAG: UDP-N-acetylmuramate dehydrogenase [Bacteroidales bacterium]
MKIVENASLKGLNTFGIDAKASVLVELQSEEDVISYLNEYGLKTDRSFILGGGSNVLFTRDFDGVVLTYVKKGIEVVTQEDDYIYVKAAAGEEWDDLVQFAVDNGWGGLENLALIPGNVGAAPVQNIGAYGVEQKDAFFQLEAISIREQQKKVFSFRDCHFGYRDSIFKQEYAKKYIITSVTYRLNKNPVVRAEYGSLKRALDEKGMDHPDVKDIAAAVIGIRKSKLPDHKVNGNAGSFFKNPVVDREKYQKLKQQYPEMVSFEMSENQWKLAAGWLIEYCGWKGKAVGHAAVHRDQALVLINLGKANGSEVIHLARLIRMSVEKQFGIKLEYEVNIL